MFHANANTTHPAGQIMPSLLYKLISQLTDCVLFLPGSGSRRFITNRGSARDITFSDAPKSRGR